MRDVAITNIENIRIAVSTDNSGGIGIKDLDLVKVPYEVTSYYSSRVAFMENMSIGANPKVVSISNFCGDEQWSCIVQGVMKAAEELKLSIEVVGSTESNFPMAQSAIGVTVIGHFKENRIKTKFKARYAVIGKPLVGTEVITYKDHMISLEEFLSLVKEKGIYEILPVGSKGIRNEIKHFNIENISCPLDIEKSAGPSSCVIVCYCEDIHEELKSKFKHKFNEVKICEKL